MGWLFGRAPEVPRMPEKAFQPHVVMATIYIAEHSPKPAYKPALQPIQEKPAQESQRQFSIRDTSVYEPAPWSVYPDAGDSRLLEFLRKAPRQAAFNEAVLNILAEKHLSPKAFYTRAGLDRKWFSALKHGGPDYQPSRSTAIRCCFALQLPVGRAEELLRTAGFALSDARKSDLLIRYCIENRIWNLFDVEDLLEAFGEKSIIK